MSRYNPLIRAVLRDVFQQTGRFALRSATPRKWRLLQLLPRSCAPRRLDCTEAYPKKLF